MNNSNWILIDTETTGFATPIFVVEIGAQKMCGWEPSGTPFRRLLNQNADIPPEAARVHGYTREILERDGDRALDVYRDFANYANGLPIVAYNLSYDLDDVLLPEWQRLGIKPIGTEGFCALKLAQRLLDPVPAGNCKLQTLRQYYRLPERGAHTALGDVETVADLMATVLRPLAEQRQLLTWSDIVEFTSATWFPSRISFGKHKGRNFREAREDQELHGWLRWLAGSSNERSARMGNWYLAQLDIAAEEVPVTQGVFDQALGPVEDPVQLTETGVVVYINPTIQRLQQNITASRSRLADLEAQYTQDHHAIDVTRSTIFGLLKKHYQTRDRLRLVVQYRKKFLSVLMQGGEEEAQEVVGEFSKAHTKSASDYEQLEAATAKQKSLSADDQIELKSLWQKLVRLYHPDRYSNEPEKLESLQQLTSAINQARDLGDLKTLREIANDPQGFMMRHGWKGLDFKDSQELADLQRMFEMLQIKVFETLEALNRLHDSPDYELQKLSALNPELLNQVAKSQSVAIDLEIDTLEAEAEKLETEIQELTCEESQPIV